MHIRNMRRFGIAHIPTVAAAFLLSALAATGRVNAEESNRNEVRRNLSQDGWTVVWGKNFTEADWGQGTYSIAESIAQDNPGPFLRWFSQVLDENFRKIEANLQDVSRRDLERWVLESIDSNHIITYRGLQIEAGFATYQRWNRVVYHEPRTRRVRVRLPFGGWTYSIETYLAEVERTVPLPNWNQFYIRYQLKPELTFWSYGEVQGGGYFQKSGDVWIEYKGGQQWATFQQVSASADSVVLYDASRNMEVSLDSARAYWRNPGGEWNYLFDRVR